MHQIPHLFSIFIGSVRSWVTTSLFPTFSRPSPNSLCHWKALDFLIVHPHISSRTLQKCYFQSFLIPHRIECSFIALKTDHTFLRRDVETHTLYQRHSFHITGVNALKSNSCKLTHAQMCVYYDQFAWTLLCRSIKPFRELHSHTM
jgi:hypothetical protein